MDVTTEKFLTEQFQKLEIENNDEDFPKNDEESPIVIEAPETEAEKKILFKNDEELPLVNEAPETEAKRKVFIKTYK